MRYIHALRLVPGRYWWNAANALAYVSCTRSSASVGLRVVRRAALYIWSSRGIASRSNRAARSESVSVATSTVWSSARWATAASGCVALSLLIAAQPRPPDPAPDPKRTTGGAVVSAGVAASSDTVMHGLLFEVACGERRVARPSFPHRG